MINVDTLTGTSVIYFRINSDNTDNILQRRIIYGTSPNIGFTEGLEYNENSNKVNGYWNLDYLYQHIHYLTDLSPATKYYFQAAVETYDGNFEYSDIQYTYTCFEKSEAEILNSTEPNITYEFWETDDPTEDWKNTIYPNSSSKVSKILVTKDELGVVTTATVYNEKNQEMDWTSTYKRLERSIPIVLNYYFDAGYIPKCDFLITFNPSYYNGTAAFSSSTSPARLHTYHGEKCGKRTLLHEFSHFMDYSYYNGLSNCRYHPRNSFGYILGSAMHKFCKFWYGYETTGTASHATHCYPFSDYYSTIAVIDYKGKLIAVEDTDFIDLLHRAGAMFNVTKGYDGFIGISNLQLIIPYYTVKDGNYKICPNETSAINDQLSVVDINSENTIWNFQYYPTTGYYTIKNGDKYLTILDSKISLSSEPYYMQIAPSVFDINGNVTNNLETVSFIKRTIVDKSNYKDEFLVKRLAIKQNLGLSTYNPRFEEFSFKLIKV